MSAKEKSDLPEVAEKRANKAASAAAELVERRGGAKENAELQSTVRTQSREAVSQAQARIREAVNRNRQDKLTALLHHLTIDVLRASFFGLKKSAAPGVDEMTWTEYAEGLEENLSDLHSRVQTGAYRALPSRRTYIPKADGRQRPLGIAALEDKIVQAAVVAILTPIYEAEFLGFSYGFRPKRSQHQALDALAFGIGRRRINWVLDCDVQSFFDKVSQSWLIRFIEHRIGDRRIIRLIAKWLTAGVLEGGHLIVTEEGTPQGAVISPLLANIYLHYVYDLWAHQWRQRCATGDVIVVRYADDSSTRQGGSLPISRQGSPALGSPFIPTRRGSSSLADPQLRIDMLGVSASLSRSISSGSRIIARPVGAARASCSGGNRWRSECVPSFERSRSSSWPYGTKGPKGRAAGSARFCAAGWPIMLCR
jgi:RNA-directed DNA polymerase